MLHIVTWNKHLWNCLLWLKERTENEKVQKCKSWKGKQCFGRATVCLFSWNHIGLYIYLFCYYHTWNSELVNDLVSELWHLHYWSPWFPGNTLSLLFLREVKEQQKEKPQLHFFYQSPSLQLVERGNFPDPVYALGLVAVHSSLTVLPSWQFLLSADLSRLKYIPVITLIISIIPDATSSTQEQEKKWC